jgi:hypothetical protein
MRHDRLLVLGGLLIGAAGVGCWSSSSKSDGSGIDAGGGSTGAGGTGGVATDGSSDAASDGSTDVLADARTDLVADLAGDLAADSSDTAGDATHVPCVTDYGARNPVQFAFNGGVNGGWIQFVANDQADAGLTTSLGASFTEGHSCPGALSFAVNFAAYGPRESGATEYFYASSPDGRNWAAYKALHAWVKIESVDPTALDGVYFYVKSGGGAKYQSDFGAGATLADWHELVVDLTNPGTGFGGVIPTDIQLMGFEVALRTSPAAGAPARPSQIVLLADDIWLEALPAGDGGAGQ